MIYDVPAQPERCSLNVLAGAALDPNHKRKRPARDIEDINLTLRTRQQVHQIHRRQPTYDELDPMMMASDPEAHAPITYKQGYMPFHRNPQVRKGIRKNRSSYESICSDFSAVPASEPPSRVEEQIASLRGAPSQKIVFVEQIASPKPEHPARSHAIRPEARRFSYNHTSVNFKRERAILQADFDNRFQEGQTTHQNAPSNIPRRQAQVYTDDSSRRVQFPAMSSRTEYEQRFVAYSSGEHVRHDAYTEDSPARSQNMMGPSSYSRASDPHAYGPPSHSYAGPPSRSYESSGQASDAPAYAQPHREQRMQRQPQLRESSERSLEPRSGQPVYDMDMYMHRQSALGDITWTREHYSGQHSSRSPVYHADAAIDAQYGSAFHRSKAHRGLGVEQQDICGHCKRHKSLTSCSDGRVRIRCECDGQHHDDKSGMHSTWPCVQDQTSYAGNDKQLVSLPMAKKIIFVEETGQQTTQPVRMPKRAKTDGPKKLTPRFILVEESD